MLSRVPDKIALAYSKVFTKNLESWILALSTARNSNCRLGIPTSFASFDEKEHNHSVSGAFQLFYKYFLPYRSKELIDSTYKEDARERLY